MAETASLYRIPRSEDEFVALFGGVYEHSSWIARAAWQQGLGENISFEELDKALAQQVDNACHQERFDLIIAHPDLAGRAAQAGTLTRESTTEQSSTGIDQCTAEEFALFVSFNAAYKKKFSFPFVMAVKGSNRHLILAAFERRIENDYQTEFDHAIKEIHKIAKFRIEDILSKH